MNNELMKISAETIEKLVIKGDLSALQPKERIEYYNMICSRLGLDPAMQPFKILSLQGKMVLYCDRSGAQQLNKLHAVSHEVRSRELIDAAGVYQVTARASLPNGRYTDSIGAVNIGGLKGDAYANAIMKAETKAKRRATLDLLGLGMMDETEAETLPKSETVDVDYVFDWKYSHGQQDYLTQLLSSSCFDEIQRKNIQRHIDDMEGMTEEKFKKIHGNLFNNQLDPVTHRGNASATEINKHIKEISQ